VRGGVGVGGALVEDGLICGQLPLPSQPEAHISQTPTPTPSTNPINPPHQPTSTHPPHQPNPQVQAQARRRGEERQAQVPQLCGVVAAPEHPQHPGQPGREAAAGAVCGGGQAAGDEGESGDQAGGWVGLFFGGVGGIEGGLGFGVVGLGLRGVGVGGVGGSWGLGEGFAACRVEHVRRLRPQHTTHHMALQH